MDRVTAWYTRLSDRKRTLCALGAYTIVFLLLSLFTRGILFFTGRSIVWAYDSSGEYYGAMAHFVRSVRALVSGLFEGRVDFAQLSYSIGMGDDVVSALNFYGFGDPLYVIGALLPIRNMEFLFTVCAYAKQFLSGWFFFLFARSVGLGKGRNGYALIGAVAYAFCGFVNGHTLHHQNFMNVTMYLPLILLGYERLIRGKKPLLLILSVAGLAFNGFYFFYMVSIFLFVYALFRFFATHPRGARRAQFLRTFLNALGCYLTGLCMAGIVFAPALYGYLHSARIPAPIEQNLLHYSFAQYITTLSKYAFPLDTSYETVALWAIFAAIALCLNRAARKRIYGFWAIFALVALYVLCPFFSNMFNGFAFVTNRSTFFISFLLCCALTQMIEPMCRLKKRDLWLMGAAALLLYGCFAFTLNRTHSLSANKIYIAYAAVLASLAAVQVFALYFVNRKHGAGRGKSLPLLVLLAVAVNLGANGILYAYDRYHSGNLIKAGAVDRVIQASPASAALALNDPDFYRVEVPAGEWSALGDEALMMDFHATAAYYSIQNAYYMDAMKDLENIGRTKLHVLKGLDQRTALLSLMGVKYYAAEADSPQSVPYGFEPAGTDEKHAVYQNKNALPLIFSAKSYIPYADYGQLDSLGKQQALLSGAVLRDASGLTPQVREIPEDRVQIPYEIEPGEGIEWQDGVLRVKKAGARMILKFASLPQTETYLWLVGLNIDDAPYDSATVKVTGAGFDKEVFLYSNKRYRHNFGAYDYLVNLGYHEGGIAQATLTFSSKGTVALEGIELSGLPTADYEAAIADLAECPPVNLAVGADCVEADVVFEENRVLLMSIPYSDGWKAEVDGKAYPIDASNGMFMALELPAGAHHVVFRYVNPWSRLGIALSALGMCACAIACASHRKSSAESFR